MFRLCVAFCDLESVLAYEPESRHVIKAVVVAQLPVVTYPCHVVTFGGLVRLFDPVASQGVTIHAVDDFEPALLGGIFLSVSFFLRFFFFFQGQFQKSTLSKVLQSAVFKRLPTSENELDSPLHPRLKPVKGKMYTETMIAETRTTGCYYCSYRRTFFLYSYLMSPPFLSVSFSMSVSCFVK